MWDEAENADDVKEAAVVSASVTNCWISLVMIRVCRLANGTKPEIPVSGTHCDAVREGLKELDKLEAS